VSDRAPISPENDRTEIHDVLVRYATGIDTKDWARFRTCFTRDVHADYGDIGVWNGVGAITDWMADTHRDMRATNHMITNIAIELSADGASAHATSYVHAVLVLAADRAHSVDAVGSYSDTLVRTAEGWRISSRVFTPTRVVMS
jgi:3-phenylpropionate/cinnamic acid dioxygenase small subunit